MIEIHSVNETFAVENKAIPQIAFSDVPRVYYKLTLSNTECILQCASTGIKPVVNSFADWLCVGIDQKVVILEKSNFKVLIEKILVSNFYTFEVFKGKLLIIAEVELYLVNFESGVFLGGIMLKDLLVDYVINDDSVTVTYCDGELEVFYEEDFYKHSQSLQINSEEA